MTDQERPPEPGGAPAPEPEPDQPTVGWTAPAQPGDQPVPPPPAGSGWSEPPPAPPPVPAGGAWSQQPPPPVPGASGPLLSASPSAAPPTGWAPQPALGQREIAPGLVFSSTPSRFAAYVVDGLIVAIVVSIVTSPFGSTTPLTSTGQFTMPTPSPLGVLIGIVINAAYFIGFWSGGRRATLGQMLFKIQVGNAFDGRPLTLEQAGKRWLGLGHILNLFSFSAGTIAAAGGLGAIWALVLLITTATSPTKQGLHDRFANSAVVRPASAGDGLVWACLIIVLILPIIAILGIISLFFIGGQTSAILSAIGESI